MFCQTCGNQLEEGSVFCINCGAKVVQARAEVEAEAKSMSLSEEPKGPMSVTGSENAVNKQMIIWRLRIIVAAVASILCMYIQCHCFTIFTIRFLIPDILIILSVLQFIIEKRETLILITTINIVISGILCAWFVIYSGTRLGDIIYLGYYVLYSLVALGVVQLVLAVVENKFKPKA